MEELFSLRHAELGEDLPFLQMERVHLAADAPIVLVVHGLGSRKEKMLTHLYGFASAGYRVFALDVALHGERRQSEQRDIMMETAYGPTMFGIIQNTISDISTLLNRLEVSKAAIHGISLGGIITFAALVVEPRLTVATVVMGSPDFAGLAEARGAGPDDPMYQVAARASPLNYAVLTYPPRPLLMLHGDQDEVVPIAGVRILHEMLIPVYQNMPERLELGVYEGIGHYYMDDMLERSVNWTQQFLPK